jgi:carboxyl-terminal processing protease
MKRGAGIIFRSVVLVLVGVAIGLFLVSNNFTNRYVGFSAPGNGKLQKVLQLVRSNYVDNIDADSIEGVAANDLLQGLDPHSMYLPPQQALAINEKLQGSFDGFGLEYQLLRDTLYITQIYPDGPAAKAGLSTGDRVISINNKKLTGKLTADLVDKIFEDQKGDNVAFNVMGPDGKLSKQLHIQRGQVDMSSLDAAYMATSDVGYIKISKFAATTDDDFRIALGKLKAEGMTKLVLDIRGNGGGYLNTATALADEFLTKGQLIVYTKGQHEPRTDYFATDSGVFQKGRMAVLIDEYSASASEILAGAMQDQDRAVIVGRRSFGKGLVQEQFPFEDGSAINLTVARYYTPSGRSIQKSYANGIESYHNDISERMKKGELFSAQNSFTDSLYRRPSKFHTVSGRQVYSGGGIMPDIFVPADSTQDTPLVQELDDEQLFTAYVIDKLQPAVKKYDTMDAFINHYNVSDDTYGDFIVYASQSIKEMDPRDVFASKQAIKTLIKAYAARFKWGDEAFFQAVNKDDLGLRKAIAAVE